MSKLKLSSTSESSESSVKLNTFGLTQVGTRFGTSTTFEPGLKLQEVQFKPTHPHSLKVFQFLLVEQLV